MTVFRRTAGSARRSTTGSASRPWGGLCARRCPFRRGTSIVASQAGLCAICLKAPAVQVDHCHETGRVRGVLCFNCNSGLGLLRDDPEAMYRAADYLEGNAWKPTLVAPGVYRLPS
ncbi:endonuclease VII domain-containing protein [Streptomyces olivaceus]|uniref:endonuclease VII domain-containing protein n=1 Tax=Streptomyces olivaceus TaxID=47716 RepID=UPI0027E09DD3|nr:endonuclease VII domain-containing protein [Streptomyces olivaceus]